MIDLQNINVWCPALFALECSDREKGTDLDHQVVVDAQTLNACCAVFFALFECSEGDGYQPVDGSVSERQHMLATEAHPTRVAYGN